jgi:hypothetical protein
VGITELNGAGETDWAIAAILGQEGFVTARGCAFKGENIWLLRALWKIPSVKINVVSANPLRPQWCTVSLYYWCQSRWRPNAPYHSC